MKYFILIMITMLLLTACSNEVVLNEEEKDDGSNIKLEVEEPPKKDSKEDNLCNGQYCIPERCCHPKKCVASDEPLECSETYCTMDYQADDIVATDCACINDTCVTLKNN